MATGIEYTETEDHVEMPKEEFERLRATIETLEDKDVIRQLQQSKEDREKGRVERWGKVKEKIGL